MNTLGYTILITAILLAIAAMLYARFAYRSREISVESDWVDLDLPFENISASENGSIDFEADQSERVPFLEECSDTASSADEVMPELTPVSERVEEEAKDDESEYFDELQEAAAGLAALMRSSPVGRSEPVVYAPEEGAAIAEPAPTETEDEPGEIFMPMAESVSTESDLAELNSNVDDLGDDPTAPLPLVEAVVESIDPGAVAGIEDSLVENADLPEESSVAEINGHVSEAPSIRALLGDEVGDQFDLLDGGLDELESLVGSIESALLSLNGASLESVPDEELDKVSEAA